MRYPLMLTSAMMTAFVSLTNAFAQTPPPTITLTQPVGSLTVVAGANVLLQASASAVAPATISTVYFYQGTTVIARLRSGPYAVIWEPPAAGSYSVYAIVTDSNGQTATSASTHVTATPAPPPIIAPSTCPSGTTPGADLTQLSDRFTGTALDPCWNVLYPGIQTRTESPGALSVVMTSGNMWWYMAVGGGYIYKDVAGNFKATSAVHVGHSQNPPNLTGAESLSGIMVANPTGLADLSPINNYVFNHVGFEGPHLVVENKTTVNSHSTWTTLPWTSSAAELRVCRVGSTFYNYHRAIGATTWIADNSYLRTDLPNVLHVGLEQCATPQTPDFAATYDYFVFGNVSSVADCTTDP